MRKVSGLNLIKRTAIAGLVLGILFLVLWFPNIQGDVLSQMNESVNRTLLEALGEDHMMIDLMAGGSDELSSNEAFSEMLPSHFGNANRLQAMNGWMEDAIHVIQYCLFTLGLFLLLRRSRFSDGLKFALVAVLAFALSYYSELFQNAVSGRGYESKDVIHNLWGVGAGLLTYWIGRKRKKRKGNTVKEVERKLIVKRLSGEDFFGRM